jgi:TolB-like protein/DNA-binding winged helix-turn-helix (wHTH) protein/Flp pilus assembly protein TadD
MSHRELYEFGSFVLDPQERILSRDGMPIPVTPKVFDTLLCLVRNQGRVLTKEDLLQEIWPDTFVEEVNLAVNISTLRKLLGENPQDGRYIVTVSGRGYRFVAQVQRSVSPDEGPSAEKGISAPLANPDDPKNRMASDLSVGAPSESPAHSERMNLDSDEPFGAVNHPDSSVVSHTISSRFLTGRELAIALAIVLFLTVVIGGYVWRGHGRPAPAIEASIAVLPFADLSQNKDQEYFSDGLADELTNDLEKIRGLKVIARSSAFQFKGKNEDLRTVGQKLGVANILEGSVRKEGNRVRITAELTKADDGFQLWSETYDRQIDDVFAVQNEIARAVSVALQVRILDPNRGADASHFRRNPAAYESYLQAQYFLARGEDKDDLDKALEYVDQAIKSDPSFAPAWALQSTVVNTATTIGLRNHEQGYREAREDAERAISLDANSALGYVALAWLKIGYEWDWNGADAALKKATTLQPGSAVILSYRAYLYECLGRLDEAIALTEEANALDPLRTNAYLGALLYAAGRYDEARAAVQRALSINPKLEGAHSTLGSILLAQGNAHDALREIELEPGEWQKLTGEALVYHALNRPHDSDAALSKLIATHAQDSPYQVAEIYAYRGETNQAFEWLGRAYQERDPGLNQLKLDPLLKNSRSDPRYVELLEKLKLPT